MAGEGNYLHGEKPTYVDFLLYETLRILKERCPTLLDYNPNLKSLMNRIELLPNIVTYQQNEKYSWLLGN